MRSLAVVVALVLLAPSIARGAPDRLEPGDKDPMIASTLAIGGFVAGVLVTRIATDKHEERGMLLGGAILAIGPSLGHLYAGQIDRVVGGTLLRGSGMGIFMLGAVQFAEGLFEAEKSPGGGLVLMAIGTAIFAASATADMIDAPRAARRKNAERRVGLAPGYARTADGRGVPTVGLTSRF